MRKSNGRLNLPDDCLVTIDKPDRPFFFSVVSTPTCPISPNQTKRTNQDWIRRKTDFRSVGRAKRKATLGVGVVFAALQSLDKNNRKIGEKKK